MEDQKVYEVAAKAEIPSAMETSPAALMLKAMAGGLDLAKLEQFMLLQEKYEANQARKAYTEAMAAFKKNPPEIEKDKRVSYKTGAGTTEYNHASLGNVTQKINSALGEHGLSAAWTTEQSGTNITVTCKITHVMGHFESTSLSAAADTSGRKNAIQALGSTISYLERYTILALTGLATHEMDDDGASSEVAYIDDKQLSTLTDLLNDKGITSTRLLKYMGVDCLEKILAADYEKAVAAIKATQAKKEA